MIKLGGSKRDYLEFSFIISGVVGSLHTIVLLFTY